MKLLVKGIVTREDAELAIQNGVDGVYISNHGGRAENSLRPTIQCVPEVAAGVAGRAPILVDGGVRRGTDIFKALALGATAVGVGRPYMWGLASFGQRGRRDRARHPAPRAAADHAAVGRHVDRRASPPPHIRRSGG